MNNLHLTGINILVMGLKARKDGVVCITMLYLTVHHISHRAQICQTIPQG